MKFSPYSYSRISTYNQCHKKFDYKYKQKVKVPFVYSEALIKGGCLHSILEKHPELSTHKHQAKYQHIANAFILSETGNFILSKDSHRELDIGLTEDLTPCEYSDKQAMFRGSVDYYTIVDEYLWIVDYKSGKFKDAKWQSFDQNMWYAIWFFQKYPKLFNIKITYQYIEHDKDHSMYLTRSKLDEYKQTLIDNIDKIESDETFNITTGPLCDYCDYQELCEKERPEPTPPKNDFLDHF